MNFNVSNSGKLGDFFDLSITVIDHEYAQYKSVLDNLKYKYSISAGDGVTSFQVSSLEAKALFKLGFTMGEQLIPTLRLSNVQR